MPALYTYRLFGVVLKSRIRFPGLEQVPAHDEGGGRVVLFRKASFRIPLRQKGWVSAEGLVYLSTPDHRRIFARSPCFGNFQVEMACGRISWMPSRAQHPNSAQMLASSRILGLLLPHFKPSLLLHAGIPVVDGRAVCFVGPSGRGKSTLTTEFLRAGFPVLSDELAVIQKGEDGLLSLPPGLPDIRLWPKAFGGMSLPGLQAERILSGISKRRYPLENNGRVRFMNGPASLRAVYLLSRRRGGRIELCPLRKQEAMLALFRNAYNRVIEAPEILRRQFEVAAEVVRTVPVKRLFYPSGFSRLLEVRRAILADLKD